MSAAQEAAGRTPNRDSETKTFIRRFPPPKPGGDPAENLENPESKGIQDQREIGDIVDEH